MYGKTIAIPPGATIREMLDDRKMSDTVFAFRMGMSLADRVAYRLELVLGPPAKFWTNLEAIYRKKLTEQG